MTKVLGAKGEIQAIAFLEKKGYRILARNFSNRFGEIDIITQAGDTIVFVEVKTRSSERYGSPQDAVTQKKQDRMMKVAFDFLKQYGLEGVPYRFEVVAIVAGQNTRLIPITDIDKKDF